MSNVSASPPAVRGVRAGVLLRGRRLAAAARRGWRRPSSSDGRALLPGRSVRASPVLGTAGDARGRGGGGGGAAGGAGRSAACGGRTTGWRRRADRAAEPARFGQRLVTVTSRLLGRPEYRGSDEILEHLDLRAGPPGRGRKRLAAAAGRARSSRLVAPVLLAALSAVALARVPDLNLPRLAHRFLVPLADVPPVTTTLLSVAPGDRDVPQGAPLTIEATAEPARRCHRLALPERRRHHTGRAPGCPGPATGGSRTRLSSVERDQWYYVSGGDAATRRYAVRVSAGRRWPSSGSTTSIPPTPAGRRRPLPIPTASSRRPSARRPPSRSPRPSRSSRPCSPPTARRSHVMARAKVTATAASLTSPAAIATTSGEARLTVLKQGPYQVDLISTREQAGAGPNDDAHPGDARPGPVVRLLGPADDVRAGPRDVVPIAYEAIDDYGLTRSRLRARPAWARRWTCRSSRVPAATAEAPPGRPIARCGRRQPARDSTSVSAPSAGSPRRARASSTWTWQRCRWRSATC